MSRARTDQLLPISCYIRTCNSERLLNEVLAAVSQIASDIVIVDSGSEDRTLEIARMHGAKIVQQSWLGWGFQKRVGEEACQHDWLLDIDSDEVLSDELIAEIRSLFENDGPVSDVFRLPLTMVDPTGRVWRNIGVSRRSKLYDRTQIRQPKSGLWDQFELPEYLIVEDLQGPLLHDPFANIHDMTAKLNKATTNDVAGGRPRAIWKLKLRLYLGFPLYFAKLYVLRGYWRVGIHGLIASIAGAYSRWTRDAKYYEAALFLQSPVMPECVVDTSHYAAWRLNLSPSKPNDGRCHSSVEVLHRRRSDVDQSHVLHRVVSHDA